MLNKEIIAYIDSIVGDIQDIRRNLHMMAEPGFKEEKTRSYIVDLIEGWGIPPDPPYIGTDVSGILPAHPRDDSGECVLLRADMDALPVAESTNLLWRSKNPNYAHVCGHDGHMAILLGTIKVLSRFPELLTKSVRFVFQPAEEELGGGKKLATGPFLSKQPVADKVFGLHGWPGLPLGSIGTRSGAFMAAAQPFSVKIIGKSGHGAKPHQTIDPIYCAARIINAFQGIISRGIDPIKPAVISVCSIHGGNTSNVIPQEVNLQGTIRFFDKEISDILHTDMEKMVKNMCESMGAHGQIVFEQGYKPLVNSRAALEDVREAVVSTLGKGKWSDTLTPVMTAEDFAYYVDRIPGCFFFLGLGSKWPELHTDYFDFNDKALQPGIKVMTALAMGKSRIKH